MSSWDDYRVPDSVARVEGCTCGGGTLHVIDCAIFSMDSKAAQAAIEAAEERIAAWKPVQR